jgi:phenylalanyl-tRNA synthetase beta chain
MKISLNWLNRLLEPAVSAAEAEQVLTHAGFPFETTESRPGPSGGDTFLDVEITSNRGDCLSHIGLAREVAAVTGRRLKMPHVQEPRRHGQAAEGLRLENRTPDVCPLFTAQVIRGVKVGPSPAWMVSLLETIGQRSINNIVDVTNWLTFEYGQPCHVFDLAKLAGNTLIIRYAHAGEKLTTLDAKPRILQPTDLVVADEARAQSLAGVIGGFDSQVTSATTDIILEAATWDPVTIRKAARRLGIRTDAGYRFERFVDPRTIEPAARRAADLIHELSGGTVAHGILSEGRPLAPLTQIDLRLARCRDIIGVDVPVAEIIRLFRGLEIEVHQHDQSVLRCTVPPWRHDITREIDLIEEVARTAGLARIEVQEKIPVAIAPPQTSERAMRELAGILTGLGFYETITFSFTTPAHADLFMPPGLSRVEVDDERRKHEPTLRPSILASLLTCRKANQDAHAEIPGGIRLYETASIFAQDSAHKPPRTIENRVLALLADIPGAAKGKPATIEQKQAAIRSLRGVIEALIRAMAGPKARLTIAPAPPSSPAWDAAAHAGAELDGARLGSFGLLSPATLAAFDLHSPVVAAELNLTALTAAYPPASSVEPLPAFPGIERDLSIIVGEPVQWASVESLISSAKIDRLEAVRFVGAYRGKQVGPGRKSVTLRLAFRDPTRTLRHEEVDTQVAGVVDLLKQKVGAELRA